MTDMNADELLDALGVEVTPITTATRTPREERIIAGFEDILRFYQTHGRAPLHGENNDIFERIYAVRLDQLRKLPEAKILLADLDEVGLLSVEKGFLPNIDELDEDALLAELGVSPEEKDPTDINVLRHVRSNVERKAAEEIADRTPCNDFEQFQPLFLQAEKELKEGARQSRLFGRDSSFNVGNFFILGGLLVYIAEKGEMFRTANGEADARLRLIYSNGTESNLLMRSLQRGLYKDESSRMITGINEGPLFSNAEIEPDDIESGTIYVLRSHSPIDYVVKHREVIHKIGVTVGKVESRISGAKKETTYLLADVEVVATYKLHNINRKKFEAILHKLFAEVQLDLEIEDRFGLKVKPREWFLVPLPVIDQVVEHIIQGTIAQYQYDPKTASLVICN
jgi:hypothetical protein